MKDKLPDRPAALGMGVTGRIMHVTPARAGEWVARNHARNRRASARRVARYAADMAHGDWGACDQPITFDDKGQLVNGLKRCLASVKSGASFLSLVLWGLPESAFLNLDGQQPRDTDAHLKIAGVEAPARAGSTVRHALAGLGARLVTDREVADFAAAHAEALRLAHEVLQKGRTNCAPVRAAILRAAVGGEDPGRLARFGEVVSCGLMEPGEQAAVLVRNAALEGPGVGTRRQRRDLYALATAALRLFLAKKAVKMVEPAEEELWPLPGDAKAGGAGK